MTERAIPPASDPSHPRRRATILLDHAQKRARDAKLDFDLTREWVLNELNRGTCAATGIPFDLKCGLGSGAHNKYAPSIDRIDPTRGYTKENCQVVIYAYNTAKGKWSHEDVMTIARALIGRKSDRTQTTAIFNCAKEMISEKSRLSWHKFPLSAADVQRHRHILEVQEPFMKMWTSAGCPTGAAAFLGPRLADGTHYVYFSPTAWLWCRELITAWQARPCEQPEQKTSLIDVLILLAGDKGDSFT